jgi:hypothetical protein
VKRFNPIYLMLAGLLFASASVAQAQSYSIPWYKIAGGGGTSTNGNFSVTGTIGQPDAGSMSGGAYSLTGGFWAIIATVQTPGTPLLSITIPSPGHVAISWSAAIAGFVPQQNSNLANTNGWSAVNTNTFPISTSGGINTVTLPISGNLYFRLVN